MGITKGNPATYVNIEAEQAEVRRTGAPLLWTLANAIRRPGISSIEKQVAEDFFDRVADEVLWAATEVYPADEWKLLSQRYISMQVRDRWRAAFTAGAKAVKVFTRDAGNRDRVAVKHEHVVPRRLLKSLILTTTAAEQVHALVQRSVGCVVTCIEDASLPTQGQGWERYIERVRVFDRKEQREIDLKSAWELQRAAWR